MLCVERTLFTPRKKNGFELKHVHRFFIIWKFKFIIFSIRLLSFCWLRSYNLNELHDLLNDTLLINNEFNGGKFTESNGTMATSS